MAGSKCRVECQVHSRGCRASPVLGPHLCLALTTSSSGQLQLAMLCYRTFPFLLPMHMRDVRERERDGVLWLYSELLLIIKMFCLLFV